MSIVYRKYIGQLYTDSLVHDEAALDYLLKTVGTNKVLLGSDYPFPLGEHHPGKLVDSMLEWDQETKVTGIVGTDTLTDMQIIEHTWYSFMYSSPCYFHTLNPPPLLRLELSLSPFTSYPLVRFIP